MGEEGQKVSTSRYKINPAAAADAAAKSLQSCRTL